MLVSESQEGNYISENLKEEEKHLHKVLQSNGYDNATRAGSKQLPSKDHTDTEQEKGLILIVQSFYEEKGVNLKQIATQMIPTVSSTEKCAL